MNFIKERFVSFLDDKLQLLSLLGFLSICCLSVFNYLTEDSIEWLLRICIYGTGFFLVLLFGHKGTWITWCVAAYTMFYFSTYRNISYFTIVVILISFYPFLRYPMLGLYVINVFVICHFHKLEIMKICFHVVACVFIYFSMQEIIRRVKGLTNKELKLTEDERIILEYLSKGVQQNDIPDFTPVTVSRKLRQAKIRNGISSTKELISRFNSI